ncbi:MAG: beta-lactamase family protein [Solirubrobacteraceae bacterium]|nr:beta-lactamase family protein [Solirubrobacteraceae bacterium]
MPRTRFTSPVAAAILLTLAVGGTAGAAPGGPGSIGANPTPTPVPTAPGNLAGNPTPTPAGPGDLTIPTPQPDPPAPAGSTDLAAGPPLDLDAIVEELEKQMHAGSTPSAGWSYSIVRDGSLVAGNAEGLARRTGDGAPGPLGRKFKQTTRIEIMSATKPVTAMAIVRALDRAHIPVDTPIGSYLPASWAKGPGFDPASASPITFRHLLTHTSGILQAFQDPDVDHTGWGNAWDGLQPLVASGAVPNVGAGEQYKNANYALLRVILPKLWALDGGPSSAVTEGNHGLRYLDYVNTKVLAPAGIAATSCWDAFDGMAARVYDKNNLGIGGSLVEYADDQHGECGGHRGLHLSSYDLAKLTSTLRGSTAIMSASARDEMFHGRLGWSTLSDRAGTDRAGLWWHGGDGFFGGGREVHTCVMNAPQRYQLAIVINSQTPTSTYQCTILKKAVNAGR